MFDSKLIRVLFAGIWFAVAAVIPIIYVFVRFEEVNSLFGNTSFMTVAFPILLSLICGSLLGSTILDSEETKDGIQSAFRGLMVAMLSYLLMFTIPVIILGFSAPDFLGLIIYSLFLFAYGLLFVGWLAALVGAVSGFLLYLCRLKFSSEIKA